MTSWGIMERNNYIGQVIPSSYQNRWNNAQMKSVKRAQTSHKATHFFVVFVLLIFVLVNKLHEIRVWARHPRGTLASYRLFNTDLEKGTFTTCISSTFFYNRFRDSLDICS